MNSTIIKIFRVLSKQSILNILLWIAIGFSSILFFLIVLDILDISIYRHDSLYYFSKEWYLNKVHQEGRWLNYILAPLLLSISGKIWSISILTFFGYFIYYVFHQITKNSKYSILIALLSIQIPPFYDLITWPATSAPAFFVLLLSIALYKRLNIFIFYILFGILFFATMSNYYYILPLLHIPLLFNKNFKETIKILFVTIIQAWAMGFVIGYIVTQAIVYYMLDTRMIIAAWRHPHMVTSWDDLIINIYSSLHYFAEYISMILDNYWSILFFLFSLILSIISNKKSIKYGLICISLCIMISHFIIILPVGIIISQRTIVPLWVGVFCLMFLVKHIKNWHILVLIPIIVIYTFRLYIWNHQELRWYAGITNTHHDMIVKELSKYSNKNFVIVLQNRQMFTTINQRIEHFLNLKRDKKRIHIEGLNSFYRWSTIAKTAYKGKSLHAMLQNIYIDSNSTTFFNILQDKQKVISRIVYSNSTTFFNILQVTNDQLVVQFNPNWNGKI